MSTQSAAEAALATLLVEVLNLEDVEPGSIEPEAPMFGDDGLGLDSIDALEIALAVAEEHGIEMQAEDEATREAFATLRSLNGFIESNK
ncbi:MAG: phosphopantetheine-binding protein [Pseudomonadota bacterium]